MKVTLAREGGSAMKRNAQRLLAALRPVTLPQIPGVRPTALVLDEDHARLLFRQLIAGLDHMHTHQCAHRFGWGVGLQPTTLGFCTAAGITLSVLVPRALLAKSRDIKLDNTLFDGQWPPFIKLADFQFAKRWGSPRLKRMKSHLGTAVSAKPL